MTACQIEEIFFNKLTFRCVGTLAFNKPYLLKRSKADQRPTGMTLERIEKVFILIFCVRGVTHVLSSILQNYLSRVVFIPEAARAQEQR